MTLILSAAAARWVELYIYRDNGQDEEGTLGLDTSKVISILTGGSVTQNIILDPGWRVLAAAGARWEDGRGATKETNWCQETFTTQILSFFSPTFLAIQIFTSVCLDHAHQN